MAFKNLKSSRYYRPSSRLLSTWIHMNLTITKDRINLKSLFSSNKSSSHKPPPFLWVSSQILLHKMSNPTLSYLKCCLRCSLSTCLWWSCCSCCWQTLFMFLFIFDVVLIMLFTLHCCCLCHWGQGNKVNIGQIIQAPSEQIKGMGLLNVLQCSLFCYLIITSTLWGFKGPCYIEPFKTEHTSIVDFFGFSFHGL